MCSWSKQPGKINPNKVYIIDYPIITELICEAMSTKKGWHDNCPDLKVIHKKCEQIFKIKAKMKLLIKLLTLIVLAKSQDYDEEAVGIIPFVHFCSFDRPMLNHSVFEDEDFCNCDIIPSPMIGRPSVKIDCEMSDHVTNLTNEVFQAQKLPVNTVSLILSFQHFSEVPEFVGDQLQHLDMSNNLITILKDLNFVHVPQLEHLDLSYNQIAVLQSQAFEQLQRLHWLDLSANRLAIVPSNIFSSITNLETLRLSGNDELAENIEDSLLSVYEHFGATKKLMHLSLDHCSLNGVDLSQGEGLKTIDLSYNNITEHSILKLPENVEILDLSGNPIRFLTNVFLPRLQHLLKLVMEDLPYLSSIDEHALYRFPRLINLTFEGSKNLTHMDAFTFGNFDDNNDNDFSLKTLNLRGCSFRTFNSSLEKAFNQLEKLQLEGNPINCNCNVRWIKYLKIETNARCHKPEVLNQKLLNEIPDKKLKCENYFMRKLVNTMILLLLLIATSLAIWYFLRRLNPSRRQKFQKVGPESPYQRVTIEPNRAEYSLY
ncbi:hypothetical protein PVAND_010650 [Polypedilum vanderplanki]|uniref:Uncharacterized protein n=1 Tax=Polypedilum vanderplanki TaxID=319348 RepID=A0A9J6CG86_POLVA|nr:hypothetical protein PVAND_010650 [Polypedilum vanderplanki]